jgi:hypothetical protein
VSADEGRRVPFARCRCFRRTTRPWRSNTACTVLSAGHRRDAYRRRDRSRISGAPQVGFSRFSRTITFSIASGTWSTTHTEELPGSHRNSPHCIELSVAGRVTVQPLCLHAPCWGRRRSAPTRVARRGPSVSPDVSRRSQQYLRYRVLPIGLVAVAPLRANRQRREHPSPRCTQSVPGLHCAVIHV